MMRASMFWRYWQPVRNVGSASSCQPKRAVAMRRYLCSISAVVVLCTAMAKANTISLSVSGFPTTYTPGSTLTFKVELSGATDINAYNVGLKLNSSSGTAGTDLRLRLGP